MQNPNLSLNSQEKLEAQTIKVEKTKVALMNKV